jgi:hypothetical protein
MLRKFLNSRIVLINKKPNHLNKYIHNNPSTQSVPCFAGNCFVELNDGTHKLVSDVSKGDILKNNAKVKCVLKTHTKGKTCQMVKIHHNGKLFDDENYTKVAPLLITTHHPIFINNKWQFPINVGQSNWLNIDCVYSFVLETHHVITINKVQVICLGHNIENDPVLNHPYFGKNVLNDLSKQSGWSSGLIEIFDFAPIYKNGIIGSLFGEHKDYA